jgi:endogenous inhibitor of DNA gyrase (YacG/DUF329 family)
MINCPKCGETMLATLTQDGRVSASCACLDGDPWAKLSLAIAYAVDQDKVD